MYFGYLLFSLTRKCVYWKSRRFASVVKVNFIKWILHFQSYRNFEIITVLSWTCENQFPNLKFAKMPISRVLNTKLRYIYQLFHRKSKTSSSEMQAKIQLFEYRVQIACSLRVIFYVIDYSQLYVMNYLCLNTVL